MMGKNGTILPVSLSATAVKDEAGNYLMSRSTIFDISARKQAEEARRQSEATLRSFFDSAPMMMGIVELLEDDILHISDNAASAQFFGIAPEAMENRLASVMGTTPQHIQRWIEYYREALRTQSPVRFEYTHQTPAGKDGFQQQLRQFHHVTQVSSDFPM